MFSFKVSVETKDAVDALKSNLEAGKRFSDWLGTSPTSLNIDKYMMMAYDTVVQRVNDYAEESNMTTVAHAAKEFLDVIAYNGGGNPATDDKSSFWEKFMTITHVFAVGCSSFTSRLVFNVDFNMTCIQSASLRTSVGTTYFLIRRLL